MNDLFETERGLPRVVVVDTNILVLLLVGAVDRSAIGRFKRTSSFSANDLDLAQKFLRRFARIATTPGILAECSNLVGQLIAPLYDRVFEAFSRLVLVLEEQFLSAREIALIPEFARFGYADAGICALPSSEFVLLTDDFRLSEYLRASDRWVVNFNHLRTPGLRY